MTTTLVRGENSYFLGARAYLVDDELEYETASNWASNYINDNPAIKWVVGRFVEADNPNNNRQAWTLEDLRMSKPSIQHAPMNMLHNAEHVVGAFVGSELLYPSNENAAGGIINPFIETVGAFWKYYRQRELIAVQKAHDEGSLFFSMECVAQTMIFEDVSSGRKEEFPYRGPRDPSYGDWNENREAIKWLNKPHFLGGALILPPVRPGWSNAEIKTLSHYMESHQELAESIHDKVVEMASHLSPNQIEDITIGLMMGEIKEEWAELVENSNRSAHVSMNGVVQSSDETASDISQNKGGVMSDKTYTEEELNAAIAAAVTPVKTELDQLKAKADTDAVQAQIDVVKAEYDIKLAELQTEVDTATVEAQAAKDELANVVAYLESVKQEAEEAALREERKEERITKIKEVANFNDDFVAKHTERWVAMSDEDFEATVEGYKVAYEAAKASKNDGKAPVIDLSATSMSASRDVADDGDKMTSIREIMQLSREGKFDPRSI